jgi:hypothetical protein
VAVSAIEADKPSMSSSISPILVLYVVVSTLLFIYPCKSSWTAPKLSLTPPIDALTSSIAVSISPLISVAVSEIEVSNSLRSVLYCV